MRPQLHARPLTHGIGLEGDRDGCRTEGKRVAVCVYYFTVDLGAYFERIGIAPSLPPSVETLRRVHVAHLAEFPFHNLNIQRGRPVGLDLEAISARFLEQGGGGYCFEQNTLLGAALAELGFPVTIMLGHVGQSQPDDLNHMLLRVEAEGETWLADAGFGGDGPIEPLPLRDGVVAKQNGLTFSLHREEERFVLRLECSGTSSVMYEFSGSPHTAADVEAAHLYASTHPSSVFRKSLTIQRATAAERVILRPRVVTRYRDGMRIDTPIEPEDVRRLARELFAIDLGEEPLLFESLEATWGRRG
jgi:N-hydroxyarylamine O-acetyltransferase